MIRLMHPVTGMNPFATARCADVGDVSIFVGLGASWEVEAP